MTDVPRADLAPSPGRAPWSGHFRGVIHVGGVTMAYAGRLKGTGGVEDGWIAAEAARDALATLSLLAPDGVDRFDLIAAAWSALRLLDHRDLSALLVAQDAEGTSLGACGLSMILAGDRPVAPPEHPIFGEPGIPERTGFFLCDAGEYAFLGTPVTS